jgi:hypothetical protein
MLKVLGSLGVCGALLFAMPAHAETRTFQGLRFETPDRLVEFRGGPRPGGPFLRLRNGERTDPHSEFIEVMSGPEAAFEGRISRENYADIVLMPATMYCGRHEVLRNTTRNEGGAQIIDVGYVCYDHSRSPQYSRQVVRSTGVFHNDRFTGFMFVRMWLKEPPHADDQLTPEEWMAPTDALAASIECLDCGR